MITLGLNAAFHDSAAALVIDGAVVAAAEEERFTRIKHAKRPVPFSAWELPFAAVDYCLAQANLTLRDVDRVAYSFDPQCFAGERLNGLFERDARREANEPAPATIGLPLEPSAHPPGGWESPWDPLFVAHTINAPRQLASGAPHHLRRRLGGVSPAAPPYRWSFVKHHLCHQASAFLAAPFDRCAVMTLDGRGEHATTTYGCYRAGRYTALGEVRMPHSLGILYERFTSHLGFLHSSDEYKVMALAALGEPRYRAALAGHVRVEAQGRFTLAPMDMERLFGPARGVGEPLEQRHFDIAASLQSVLEDTALELARWLRTTTGEGSLALAGGVALNCVLNARLRDSGIFDSIWVQPAAGDAGTALGAALWIDACERGSDRSLAPRAWAMEHAYWGPAFDDTEVERQLRWAGLRYRRPRNVALACAELLAGNRVLGWYQGRMEYGPRALGARSILASPIDPAMQARLNDLKDREDFRPVAPAVPQEDLAQWFAPADANGGKSPFMLFVYDVLPGRSERIPSACHADRTARVQTVDRRHSPRFHEVLREFGRLTGVPILINTSFNVRGEPIVCTPRDAIEAFFSTPLDALAIGSFIVEKQP